jgi:hypothetical protein
MLRKHLSKTMDWLGNEHNANTYQGIRPFTPIATSTANERLFT